jgi:hypothetical protein
LSSDDEGDTPLNPDLVVGRPFSLMTWLLSGTDSIATMPREIEGVITAIEVSTEDERPNSRLLLPPLPTSFLDALPGPPGDFVF